MRWNKYLALREEALTAEAAYLNAEGEWSERLLQRLGLEMPSMQAHAGSENSGFGG